MQDDAQRAARLAIWTQYFNVEHLQTRQHKFGLYVATDGVGASVKMERPKHQAAPIPELDLHGKRYVGVDPGTTTFFTAVDQRDDKVSCSTGEYYHRAQFNQSRAWRERKLHAAGQGFEAWQSDVPPTRSGDVDALQQHVAYVTPRLAEALAFHGTRQQRRTRWNCHIRKQSFLHVMARRLTADSPKSEVRWHTRAAT